MRPIANIPSAGDTWHGACDGLATPQTLTHMSCFITTEAALDTASDASGPDPTPRFHPTCARRKRSLDSSSRSGCSRLPSPVPTTAGESVASLSSSALDFDLAPSTPHLSSHSPLVASGLSGSMSAISSASSRRHSMTASSHSRTRERSPAVSSDGHPRRDIPPQFIMPSLAVPQRRPFSETGKSIGKLKLMVAGSPGMPHITLLEIWHRLTLSYERGREVIAYTLYCPLLRSHCSHGPSPTLETRGLQRDIREHQASSMVEI
jgi:hypothetical protein